MSQPSAMHASVIQLHSSLLPSPPLPSLPPPSTPPSDLQGGLRRIGSPHIGPAHNFMGGQTPGYHTMVVSNTKAYRNSVTVEQSVSPLVIIFPWYFSVKYQGTLEQSCSLCLLCHSLVEFFNLVVVRVQHYMQYYTQYMYNHQLLTTHHLCTAEAVFKFLTRSRDTAGSER